MPNAAGSDHARPVAWATTVAVALALLASPGASGQPAEPLPVLVTGSVHIDPIPTFADSIQTVAAYAEHRQALQWYVALAESTGLRLSAQMTGVYAEACVRQGHEGDFAGFMPGGHHHLGTHLHANVKMPEPYRWRTVAPADNSNPDTCRVVLSDNIPWVNRVFEGSGSSSVANDFFHGSHATYPGMDTLWCRADPAPLPFDNCFTISGSRRGAFYIHRGGWGTEPAQSPDTSCVKLAEVGGIIGYDQEHGPEGTVWGTVPYQKRDFLRVYIEWREAVRRGESSAVRIFNWMIHPYQLVPAAVGTDGRPPREHIEELVAWLDANFIGRADETGAVVATYANAGEMRDAYEAWSAAHPVESAALQATLATGQEPLYLPALHERLDVCSYRDRRATSNPDLVLHEFTDRDAGTPVFLAWSRGGDQPLEPDLAGLFRVLLGDATTEVLPSGEIAIGEEPVILEAAASTAVVNGEARGAARGAALATVRVHPTPVREWAEIALDLPRATRWRVAVLDAAGRERLALGEELLGPGERHMRLDARGLPAGVYFIRVAAGAAASTTKAVVVR